jgi:hypothetical protein
MLKKLRYREGFNPLRIRIITMLLAIVPVFVAMAATLAVFKYGLDYFPRTTLLPTEYQVGPEAKEINWDFLGSITSLATLALIVGGLVFAFIDYVQGAVQRKREESESSFTMYQVMYDRLMNSESIEARRWVIVNLKSLDQMNNDRDAWFTYNKSMIDAVPADSKTGRAPGKDFVKRILNDFDFIGFVDKNYWKMEGELAEWMSSPVAKVWERVSAYVEKEADLRKEPDYYISARDFAKYCVKWRNKQNRPQPEVIENGT